MAMKFIDEIEIKNKKILGRFDFNVPIKNGEIQDDSRIRAAIPTITYILKNGGRLIACSHLGKPKGKVVEELSLRPVAKRLEELLNKPVKMAPDCIGDEVISLVNSLKEGGLLLLENLRFHPGETENDPEFSRELSKLGDVYLNDAFGVVHRSHASVVGVTEHIKEVCAGFLIKKEVEYLSNYLKNPKRPFVLIAGGVKVSTKLGILNSLMDKVDRILIGGAMANTFRKSQGYPVGRSMVENDLIDDAKEIIERAKNKGVGFYLPVDYVLGKEINDEIPMGVYPYQNIDPEGKIFDIGPATHTLFAEVLKDAHTVVWNGPLGAFENPTFSQGSFGVAQSVAAVDGITIVGGGDTDNLIHGCNLQDKITFISTGGGSFLKFLEGKKLPGLKVLGLYD
jgi:phosphoglycerate kinase